MKTHFPAYVVLDIPEPIRSAVYELRRRLRYRAAKLPVEITVARSSGVGSNSAGVFNTSARPRIGMPFGESSCLRFTILRRRIISHYVQLLSRSERSHSVRQNESE